MGAFDSNSFNIGGTDESGYTPPTQLGFNIGDDPAYAGTGTTNAFAKGSPAATAAAQQNAQVAQKTGQTAAGAGAAATAAASPVAPGSPGFKSVMLNYVAQAAQARGIDPTVAQRVAMHEGVINDNPALQSYVVTNGVREQSYGPFQLNFAGGIGSQMLRETGIDARKPENWQAGVDYALNHVVKKGWGDFHGAAAIGLQPNAGLGANRSVKPVSAAGAAATAAAEAPPAEAYAEEGAAPARVARARAATGNAFAAPGSAPARAAAPANSFSTGTGINKFDPTDPAFSSPHSAMGKVAQTAQMNGVPLTGAPSAGRPSRQKAAAPTAPAAEAAPAEAPAAEAPAAEGPVEAPAGPKKVATTAVNGSGVSAGGQPVPADSTGDTTAPPPSPGLLASAKVKNAAAIKPATDDTKAAVAPAAPAQVSIPKDTSGYKLDAIVRAGAAGDVKGVLAAVDAASKAVHDDISDQAHADLGIGIRLGSTLKIPMVSGPTPATQRIVDSLTKPKVLPYIKAIPDQTALALGKTLDAHPDALTGLPPYAQAAIKSRIAAAQKTVATVPAAETPAAAAPTAPATAANKAAPGAAVSPDIAKAQQASAVLNDRGVQSVGATPASAAPDDPARRMPPIVQGPNPPEATRAVEPPPAVATKPADANLSGVPAAVRAGRIADETAGGGALKPVLAASPAERFAQGFAPVTDIKAQEGTAAGLMGPAIANRTMNYGNDLGPVGDTMRYGASIAADAVGGLVRPAYGGAAEDAARMRQLYPSDEGAPSAPVKPAATPADPAAARMRQLYPSNEPPAPGVPGQPTNAIAANADPFKETAEDIGWQGLKGLEQGVVSTGRIADKVFYGGSGEKMIDAAQQGVNRFGEAKGAMGVVANALGNAAAMGPELSVVGGAVTGAAKVLGVESLTGLSGMATRALTAVTRSAAEGATAAQLSGGDPRWGALGGMILGPTGSLVARKVLGGAEALGRTVGILSQFPGKIASAGSSLLAYAAEKGGLSPAGIKAAALANPNVPLSKMMPQTQALADHLASGRYGDDAALRAQAAGGSMGGARPGYQDFVKNAFGSAPKTGWEKVGSAAGAVGGAMLTHNLMGGLEAAGGLAGRMLGHGIGHIVGEAAGKVTPVLAASKRLGSWTGAALNMKGQDLANLMDSVSKYTDQAKRYAARQNMAASVGTGAGGEMMGKDNSSVGLPPSVPPSLFGQQPQIGQ